MPQRIVDVTLENLFAAPAEVLAAVFWELDVDPPVDPRFEKEEWFSSTLLEWGPCGKLVLEDPESRDRAVAFAQYGPGPLFPRLSRFRAGSVSPDAVYLSYCHVGAGHRGKGLGTFLVRVVAREMADRGYVAVEALADRDWDGSWVLPAGFLEANGFGVIREDPRYPLMRLDLRSAIRPREADAAAARPEPVSWLEAPLTAPEPA